MEISAIVRKRDFTVEVAGVDIEPTYCSCGPQFDDCPVITDMRFPEDRLSKPLTSQSQGYVDGFPIRHKERRWDRIAL